MGGVKPLSDKGFSVANATNTIIRNGHFMSDETYTIYTDGACLGNPGPGGYAALIILNGEEQVITGSDAATTNNRMEMTAAIKGLEAIAAGSSATLHSDSQIVIKGMTEWMPSWKAKNWKNAAKKPVANQDLWLQLDTLNAERRVTWTWVRGHAGHPENERVDGLANAQAEKAANEIGWSEGSRYGFGQVAG
jgi:ribonuclease HI